MLGDTRIANRQACHDERATDEEFVQQVVSNGKSKDTSFDFACCVQLYVTVITQSRTTFKRTLHTRGTQYKQKQQTGGERSRQHISTLTILL